MNNLVKIKFCGMSKKKDIEVAIKLGVNWIGIIYVKTSPRYVDFQKSDVLINEFKGMINFVGVFVDADDMLIKRAVNSGINTIQLHGKESPKRCQELRDNFNLPVIKAFFTYSSFSLLLLTLQHLILSCLAPQKAVYG